MRAYQRLEGLSMCRDEQQLIYLLLSVDGPLCPPPLQLRSRLHILINQGTLGMMNEMTGVEGGITTAIMALIPRVI